MEQPILAVRNLRKYFKTPHGLLHAVDDISFTINRGKTLGIVGESGCGKSTTGRCILRLIEPTTGEIWFDGEDVAQLNPRQLRAKRLDMQIIFQDPFSSLNPRNTVMQTIAEGVRIQKAYRTETEIQKRVLELMDIVGLAERLYNSYPHELDGGRRQRIGIARALAVNPKIIICDEPVSALDVSIQAQILNLLKDLQTELGLTYVFITHNLAVVNHISDEVLVMYLGQNVEQAPTEELFNNPKHPYTQSLFSAIPIPKVGANKERIIIQGEVSSPINPPVGCRFAPRCPYRMEICTRQDPALTEVTSGHLVACHLYTREESSEA